MTLLIPASVISVTPTCMGKNKVPGGAAMTKIKITLVDQIVYNF